MLSCIFSGLVMGPTLRSFLKNLPGGSVADTSKSLFDQSIVGHKAQLDALVKRENATENPYKLHKELGELMTRNCTVVRNNADLAETVKTLETYADRYQNCSLSDRSHWTNQNLSFTRALGDMIELAKVIAKGALQRNECRGAHYKPECSIPAPDADDHETLHQQAEEWCRKYKQQNDEWLKTTVAEYAPDGPHLSYETVDTEAIPPRPRTYGLKGAEIIDEVWKEKYATPSAKAQMAAT
jgi:succinate dehydrogenase / fumarate reductase flavoprotein subunit